MGAFGSFWIAMKAIRGVFEAEDGFSSLTLGEAEIPNAKQISAVRESLFDHFRLPKKEAIFELLYFPEQFEKSKIASFCLQLSKVARSGDDYAKKIFEEAGEMMAQHILSISRHFDREMCEELPLLAVGSVFKSWDLLKPGFSRRIRSTDVRRIKKVSIFQLDETAAVGAAILASQKCPLKNDILGVVDPVAAAVPLMCERKRKQFDEITLV